MRGNPNMGGVFLCTVGCGKIGITEQFFYYFCAIFAMKVKNTFYE